MKSRLITVLERSRKGFLARLKEILPFGRKVDAAALESLEELLLSADVGVHATGTLVEEVREAFKSGEAADGALPAFLRERVRARLEGKPRGIAWARSSPTVILVTGVNGTGKTTSVAKLAHRFKGEGKKVLVAAADTFRAAAVEQLSIWCGRIGVDVIRHLPGEKGQGDPAAVVFDAAQAAAARKVDVLLVDTAGRLHTHDHLMKELEKVSRVAGKCVPGAPHEVLLVLDATTGQNAVSQAKEFRKAVPVTGIVLAKMDGTAKGGVALAIEEELGIRVKFVGLGEKIEDLEPFDPAGYAEGLAGG